MARMGDIEREAAEAVACAAHEAGDWFHPHHSASQTPAVMPVTVGITTAKGELMSLLDSVKTAVADVEAKVEGVDEAVLAKVKALQANPGAMKLIDTALPILHIPPEEFDVVVGVLAKIGSYWQAPDAAQPSQAA